MVTPAGARGIVDSDILIDARRGLADGINFLAAQHGAGGVAISVVSAMELVVGCRNANDLAAVQRFLSSIVSIPLSAAVSSQALVWIETFTLSHGLLIPDALIAATALEHQVPLYTKNVRHFSMLPGLQVVRPY